MARLSKLPILALLGLVPLSACATTSSASPTEVTRFTRAEAVAPGSVMIVGLSESAPGTITPASVEAVGRELGMIGFTPGTSDDARYETTVKVEQGVGESGAGGRPGVNVGIGGSTGWGGSWGRGRGGWGGSGLGIGVGLDLTSLFNKPRAQVNTRLSVSIRDRATGTVVWEGRAENSSQIVRGDDPSGMIANKLASALFKGFPGQSGETIIVK